MLCADLWHLNWTPMCGAQQMGLNLHSPAPHPQHVHSLPLCVWEQLAVEPLETHSMEPLSYRVMHCTNGNLGPPPQCPLFTNRESL